jgi:hypothetical protein
MEVWSLTYPRPPSSPRVPPSVVDVTHNHINDSPTLTHLSGVVSLESFCPEGFVGIGVSTGTDAFVQNFATKTCQGSVNRVIPFTAISESDNR